MKTKTFLIFNGELACLAVETWREILSRLGYEVIAVVNIKYQNGCGVEVFDRHTGMADTCVVVGPGEYVEYLTTTAPKSVIEAILIAGGNRTSVVDFDNQYVEVV